MRKFEKISLEQFTKDGLDKSLYDFGMPIRKTISSAGYDIVCLSDVIIEPGDIKKIPTGIKADMNDGEVLMLYVRGSLGFKYNTRLINQTGVVDRDYYNNTSNEGHIWVGLQNESKKTVIIKKGEAFCQGIFMKYLTVDNEEEIENERKGGFGSTNR
jgi:dUTP pyrophosphatase